jgi:polysaccharide deacetylase family protein (PEP-CTERM system associated)
VEDYFQVEAFSAEVSRDGWDGWQPRVEANTRRILDLCDQSGVRGTYFVLGWVAQRFPGLVREIAARGHEVACHSFWHRPIYRLSPADFRQDLREAKDVIEQTGGQRVLGYRAPSWSITARSLWALDILAEEGFVYDSSIYPIRHDLYGMPGAERFPHRLKTSGGRELLEFPPASVRLFGSTLPAAGGGYLRILPFAYTRWAMRRLAAEKESAVVVVYCHPWEFDPDQPRIAARLKSRFRHYTNLARMQPRVTALLRICPFEPFRNLLHDGVEVRSSGLQEEV